MNRREGKGEEMERLFSLGNFGVLLVNLILLIMISLLVFF